MCGPHVPLPVGELLELGEATAGLAGTAKVAGFAAAFAKDRREVEGPPKGPTKGFGTWPWEKGFLADDAAVDALGGGGSAGPEACPGEGAPNGTVDPVVGPDAEATGGTIGPAVGLDALYTGGTVGPKAGVDAGAPKGTVDPVATPVAVGPAAGLDAAATGGTTDPAEGLDVVATAGTVDPVAGLGAAGIDPV